MSRAIVSIEPGQIDHASVVPLVEDPDRCLLTIVGEDARIVLGVRIDDLWPIASACREAAKRRTEERRMEDLAAEVMPALEPMSDMRDFANELLRGMAGEAR